MSPQQHLHIMQLAHLIMFDGDESHLTKTVTLHAVMYDIAQTIKLIAMSQFFLSLPDGSRHTETEPTTTINFNLNHLSSIIQNTYPASPEPPQNSSSVLQEPSAQQE